MLDNCYLRDTIAIYQWFDKKDIVHIHNQKEPDIGNKHTVESDTYMSVSRIKIRFWSR